ncbi:hypothetical protein NG796_25240 [Laspinema sp. A4]|uniref:hypothetical protein n=1 Tax=Laspinema sp. D2d TaxID=2953686 RepID=UPI0021BB277E|nr:hypothetical protein [Laspinema sp. D2d]MCT7986581.1 hypothetical protein [Laspinema sp. D2d]
MRIAKDVTELIGRTPLVEIYRIPNAKNCVATIVIKAEGMNPAASGTDRIGLGMIGAAEEAGLIKPGKMISYGRSGAHTIQGIGAGLVPKVLRVDLIDEVISVSDDEPMVYGQRLATEEGLLSGISNGAALAGAIKVGKRPENAGRLIVMIKPSLGERYLSTPMYQNLEPFESPQSARVGTHAATSWHTEERKSTESVV